MSQEICPPPLAEPGQIYGQLIEDGKNDGYRFDLKKKICLVGKDEDCDIRLLEERIGSRHCQIVHNGDSKPQLVKLDKTESVLVNGVTVEDDVTLSNDDIVNIGGTDFRFLLRFAKAYGRVVRLKEKGGEGSKFPLNTPTCLIGSGPNCGIQINSDETVSISWTDGHSPKLSLLTNHESPSDSSVLLNEKPLDSINGSELSNGDVISIGGNRFKLELYHTDKPDGHSNGKTDGIITSCSKETEDDVVEETEGKTLEEVLLTDDELFDDAKSNLNDSNDAYVQCESVKESLVKSDVNHKVIEVLPIKLQKDEDKSNDQKMATPVVEIDDSQEETPKIELEINAKKEEDIVTVEGHEEADSMKTHPADLIDLEDNNSSSIKIDLPESEPGTGADNTPAESNEATTLIETVEITEVDDGLTVKRAVLLEAKGIVEEAESSQDSQESIRSVKDSASEMSETRSQSELQVDEPKEERNKVADDEKEEDGDDSRQPLVQTEEKSADGQADEKEEVQVLENASLSPKRIVELDEPDLEKDGEEEKSDASAVVDLPDKDVIAKDDGDTNDEIILEEEKPDEKAADVDEPQAAESSEEAEPMDADAQEETESKGDEDIVAGDEKEDQLINKEVVVVLDRSTEKEAPEESSDEDESEERNENLANTNSPDTPKKSRRTLRATTQSQTKPARNPIKRKATALRSTRAKANEEESEDPPDSTSTGTSRTRSKASDEVKESPTKRKKTEETPKRTTRQKTTAVSTAKKSSSKVEKKDATTVKSTSRTRTTSASKTSDVSGSDEPTAASTRNTRATRSGAATKIPKSTDDKSKSNPPKTPKRSARAEPKEEPNTRSTRRGRPKSSATEVEAEEKSNKRAKKESMAPTPVASSLPTSRSLRGNRGAKMQAEESPSSSSSSSPPTSKSSQIPKGRSTRGRGKSETSSEITPVASSANKKMSSVAKASTSKTRGGGRSATRKSSSASEAKPKRSTATESKSKTTEGETKKYSFRSRK